MPVPWAGILCRLLAVLALMASGAASAERIVLGAPAAEADATVGCMYPMTGRSAIFGRDSVGGIRLALADIAAHPGEPVRLRVIVDDSRSKASYAVRLAKDFIEREGAQFLCGVVSSGVGLAVSRVSRAEEVIMIGTDHASSRLAIELGHRYYFRLNNDTWFSYAAGARYLRDLQSQTGWRRLAFLGPDYEYGHISWRDLRTALDRLGVEYEVVAELWPKLYEPDYSIYIQALLEAEPDIVVTALWGGDFLAFIQQALPTRLFEQARLANFDAGGNYDVMVALGEHPPPGLILSARHHVNWPDTPRNRAFVSGFHRLEGRYPTYAAGGAYAGILAIARAIRIAGGANDNDALIAALEGLHLKLPEDPPGFTSYIDPLTHQIVQMQAIGVPVPNMDYPPAKVMLGHWSVYDAESLKPSAELVRHRRERAPGGAAGRRLSQLEKEEE